MRGYFAIFIKVSTYKAMSCTTKKPKAVLKSKAVNNRRWLRGIGDGYV